MGKMRTPANKYLICVEKEQKLGKLFVPIAKGAEESVLRPVSGTIKAMPMKFTKQFGIASNTGSAMLNAEIISKSLTALKQGDEVIISYMATDRENFFYSTEEGDFYIVPVHHLIALKTKEAQPYQAIAGKVLIKPLEKAEFESQYLISLHKKKDLGVGEIVSCAEGMREKYAPGQKVVYLEKLAEWIELDGVKYDFVYTGEVLALLD
jgi:co-chaperonin GroES (HSP10)